MQLSQKQKTFSEIFGGFPKSRLNSEYFEKKMTITAFVFPKLQTLKRCLDISLKSPVSEDHSGSNMEKVAKQCWNLHRRRFITFIDHCQVNWVGKSLSYWHAKSWDCLLANWLTMKSILFLIERIWRYQFRWYYLKNKKFFWIFYFTFEICIKFWNFFLKKMTLTAFVFPKLRTPKSWLDKSLKSHVSEIHSTSNMVKVAKHCWNLHDRPFIIFIDHFQVYSVGKNLSYWHAKSWDCLLTYWLPMKSILFLIETI